MSRYENPQRKNKISIPGFKDFHAHLNCKLTHGNKNQTQLTFEKYIKFSVQKQTEQNRNDDKYNQTGIIVKIHTNHDGV